MNPQHTDEQLKLENQICFPLYATSRLVTKLYQPLLENLDVTYPQYLVLLVLWENDRKSVTELCQCLMLETNTLTPLLKRMEQKGIIRRTRSKTDERTVLIELTEQGKQLKQQALRIPGALFQQFENLDLSMEEIRQLKHILDKVLKSH